MSTPLTQTMYLLNTTQCCSNINLDVLRKERHQIFIHFVPRFELKASQQQSTHLTSVRVGHQK